MNEEQRAALAVSLGMPVLTSWEEIEAAYPKKYAAYLRACGIPA